jgi:hypothetical protein
MIDMDGVEIDAETFLMFLDTALADETKREALFHRISEASGVSYDNVGIIVNAFRDELLKLVSYKFN